MRKPDDVVAEARAWIGTPFAHGQRLKGHACDCIGLAWGVGEAAGVLSVPASVAAEYAGYGRAPQPAIMRRALRRCLTPIRRPRLADIAWVHWDDPAVPMHLAILAEHRGRPTLIHALTDRGVVEHGFTALWRSRIASWFRYPGLET